MLSPPTGITWPLGHNEPEDAICWLYETSRTAVAGAVRVQGEALRIPTKTPLLAGDDQGSASVEAISSTPPPFHSPTRSRRSSRRARPTLRDRRPRLPDGGMHQSSQFSTCQVSLQAATGHCTRRSHLARMTVSFVRRQRQLRKRQGQQLRHHVSHLLADDSGQAPQARGFEP